MAYSEAECQQAWESVSRAGSRAERIERNRGWIEYFGSIFKRQENAGKGEATETFKKEFPLAVTSFLMHEKVLTSSSSVLDIGAGTGAFTLPFAANCRSVTALDMCQSALDILQTRCREKNLSNVETVLGMWETFPLEKKFNLTFASMCSAICDKQEIINMESITDEYCCLLTVARGSHSLHRTGLRKMLLDAPPAGLSSDVIYIYNMLYAMGRFPNIKYYRECQHSQMTADEAYNIYRIYFNIFGLHGEKSDKIIRDYISENATGGLLYDEIQMNTALLYWRPRENEH
jgi:SAM-dependent methyltransferase